MDNGNAGKESAVVYFIYSCLWIAQERTGGGGHNTHAEACLLYTSTTADDLTKCFVLEFDEDLPDKLLKRPLMFYIYDDLPILKLYRSVYISAYQWKD